MYQPGQSAGFAVTFNGPDAVCDVLAALESSSVVLAVLRPGSAGVRGGGDVDLLVRPCDMARADEVLRVLGWLSPANWGHGTHRFYVLYEPRAEAWYELDLVTRLDFGPMQSYKTDLAEACLHRIVREEGGLPVLDPCDAFWVLFAHLAWKQATAARLAELEAYARNARVEGPVAAMVTEYMVGGRDGLDQVLAAVSAGDWVKVETAQDQMRRRWRRSKAIEVSTEYTKNWLLRRTRPARNRGRSIALLGLDGAGKTTVATRLKADVAWPSASLYMGVWRESTLDHLVRRLIGAQLLMRIGRLSRVALVMRYHQYLGRLVILDRYIIDAELPSPEVDWKSRVSNFVVLRTAPEPDRLLFLDVPPSIAFARKGELSIDEMEDRRRFYLELCQRYQQLVTIDASRPLSEVLAEVNQVLWDDLVQSTSTRT